MPVETTSASSEFVRQFTGILCELQLQPGIHRRIEHRLKAFADEHPNARSSYLAREVDETYFAGGRMPATAIARPKLHGLTIEGDRLYEFVAFAHGFRYDTTALESIVHIQETWLEPEPEKPFVLRIALYHGFGAATVLLATTGEGQDAAQEFVGRLRYLRGW